MVAWRRTHWYGLWHFLTWIWLNQPVLFVSVISNSATICLVWNRLLLNSFIVLKSHKLFTILVACSSSTFTFWASPCLVILTPYMRIMRFWSKQKYQMLLRKSWHLNKSFKVQRISYWYHEIHETHEAWKSFFFGHTCSEHGLMSVGVFLFFIF